MAGTGIAALFGQGGESLGVEADGIGKGLPANDYGNSALNGS